MVTVAVMTADAYQYLADSIVVAYLSVWMDVA